MTAETTAEQPTGWHAAYARYQAGQASVRNDGYDRARTFEAGWEAALAELERCAAHWEAFGLTEQGRRMVGELRKAIRVTREGWTCVEDGHPAICRSAPREPLTPEVPMADGDRSA